MYIARYSEHWPDSVLCEQNAGKRCLLVSYYTLATCTQIYSGDAHQARPPRSRAAEAAASAAKGSGSASAGFFATATAYETG